MIVERKLLKEVLPDNDEAYFSLLEGVIDSIDAYAQISIVQATSAYHFRVVPSTTRDLDILMEEIIRLNKMMGIKLSISKSIKSSTCISFSIPLG